MDQQAYWDGVSGTKQFTTPFQAELFARFVGREQNILDVGCGYGRTLGELHRRGYRSLTGVDFSRGMILRGRRENPTLDLRVMEGKTLDFPDETFDAAILFAVLTCILRDADQAFLIREIRRVLRPGGVLYVNDFLLNTDERNLARYAAGEAQLGVYGAFTLPEGAVLRHQEEGQVKRLLSDFETLHFERLTFPTMNGHTSNGFCYFGRK